MKTNKMNLIPSTFHPRHLAALALGVLWLAGSPARAATSANNVFWLDASAITGLANGQSVTSWLDRSGQGNHATGVVGTSGTGLTYNPAGLNGKGTVSFDQVDDYFLVTNSASLAVSNHTFFFVANVPNKTAASGNGTKGLLQKRDGGGTNYCLNYGLAEASSPRFERAKLYNSAAGDSGSVARASRDPSADGGAVFDFRDGNVIGTARLAGTDSSIDNTAISLFWKGLEETTYTLQTAGPTSGPFVNTNDMVIGTQSYNQTTNIWFYGSMGELLLFNTALTGTEITDVSAYLSQKWGIALASGVTGDAVAGALLVGSPIPTTSALQSSLNPSTNGNSVTFTATVQTNGTATAMAGNAGGTMVFKAGATTLGSAGVTNGVATFATSALPVRTNSISAQYSGDPNYAANVSSVLPQLVYPVSLTASSTMLISSTNSAPFATVVTFTATVQTNGTTATDAIGTVVFKDAGTPLATNNVSVGVAQWTTDGLAVGSHSMTAEYSGDIVYQPSTTITPWTQVVLVNDNIVTNNLSVYFRADNVDGAGNPGSALTTTLVNLAIPGTYNGTLVNGSGVVANAGQAGTPYAYGVALSSTALTRIEDNTYRIAGGVNKVTAATWEFWLRLDSPASEASLYGEYPSSAGGSTRHYLKAMNLGTPPTSNLLFDEYAPSGGGASSANGFFSTNVFTQIVITKNNNDVRFYKNGNLFSTATISETYSGSTVARTWFGVRNSSPATGTEGQFNLIRVYDRVLSDTQVLLNYQASLKLATTLALTSSSAPNPSVLGSNVTFTATVQAQGGMAADATGKVVFKDGTTPLSTNDVVSGAATYTTGSLALGAHTIWAEFSGATNYLASTNSLIQQVDPYRPPTTTDLVSSGSPSLVGSGVVFTATVKSNGAPVGDAGGTVVFKAGLTALSTNDVTSGVATYTNRTFTIGLHSITAQYSGDASYAASSSSTVTQVVQTATTLTLRTSFTPSAPADPVSFTATVSSNGLVVATGASGTVVFKVGGTPFLTNNLVGGMATCVNSTLPLGTSLITAEYSGNTFYLPSTNTPALAQVVSATAIAQASLSVYFRADNVDGAGNPGTAVTTNLVNLASPGTNDGTLVNGAGVIANASQAGTPYAYGVPLSSAKLTRLEANGYRIAGGVNKATAASWEFWLRLDAGAEGSFYGEYASSAGSSTRHFFRAINYSDANSYLLFDEYAPSGGSADSAGGYFQTSVFTQLVITKSNDIVNFYKNGALFSTATNSETYSGSTIGRTWFGVRPATTPVGTDGQFNIIRVYDRVLSDAQVAGNYSATAQHQPASITLGSSVIVAAKGSDVIFTATVQTNGVAAGDATGSMVFRVDGAPLATNAVSSGVATFNTSALTLGSHTIQARYSGDTVYGANSSPNLGQVVAALDVTVTTASYNNPSVAGDPVTFQGVVQTNGGPVTGMIGGTMTFKDGSTILDSGIPVTSAYTYSYTYTTLTPGWHYITAEFSGDTNYSGGGSSLSYAQAVASSTQTPTTMTLGSSANPSTNGDRITLIATVYTNGYVADGSAGTVVFKDGPVTLGSAAVGSGGAGVANFLTAPLAAGVHAFTAEYSGNATYGPSPAAWLQTVQASATLALVSSANPSALGANVTFTATVQTNGATATVATGTVSFYDGGSQLAGTPNVVNGVATLTISTLILGSHDISAYYTGDALSPQVYPAASSAALAQVVKRGTTTTLASSLNPSTQGSNVTFTATVRTNGVAAGDTTGTVTFKNGASTLGSPGVTNGVATFETSALPLGTNSLTAEYSGDDTYLASTHAPPLAQVVNSSIPATGTNLVWSVNGGQLTLSWPGYLGWYLQNSPAVGVGALWADMAGSQLVTTTNLPLNAAPGAFYRLRHP